VKLIPVRCCLADAVENKDEMSDAQKFSMLFEAEHQLNAATNAIGVPCNWVTYPPDEWASRSMVLSHSKGLAESFKKSMTVNLNVKIIVVFDPDNAEDMKIYNAWTEDKAKFNILDYPQLAGRCWAIIGGHTSEGIKMCHEWYSGNPLFKDTFGQIFFVKEGDPDALRWAHFVGARDNFSNDVYKKVCLGDIVRMIRKKVPELNDPNCTAHRKAQIKSDLMEACNLKSQAFGQHKTLAVLSDRCYKLVTQLVTNTPPVYAGFAPVLAMTYFTNIGSIPEPNLFQLLQNIFKDKLSMKQFSSSCNIFKAKRRLRNDCFQALGIKDEEELKALPAADELGEAIKGIMDDYYLDVIRLRLNDTLPPNVLGRINKLVTVKNDHANAKAKVRMLFEIWVVVVMTVEARKGSCCVPCVVVSQWSSLRQFLSLIDAL